MQNINQATELNSKVYSRKKEEDTMPPVQLLSFRMGVWEITKRHSKT